MQQTTADMTAASDVASLEARLSEPDEATIHALANTPGDLVILGVGGKMGPTLARMARRSIEAAGVHRRVVGVSRFTNPEEREKLEAAGVETVAGDLMDAAFVASLPDAADVVYMAGMKFGATGNESLTWAMNTLLPARVAERYAESRIAAFSTGNVYGMCPLSSGGSVETDEPNPQGEYAMSCLGRERLFEHYSLTRGTRVTLLRLNYAVELRYGVLIDLAQRILTGEPIDLSMGMCNLIWQRDANAMALRSLEHASSPATVLNIAGPEQLSIERCCRELARCMAKDVAFVGEPGPDAILSNGQRAHRLMGYPQTTPEEMIKEIAAWVASGGEVHGKPTKFEVRDGKF